MTEKSTIFRRIVIHFDHLGIQLWCPPETHRSRETLGSIGDFNLNIEYVGQECSKAQEST